jgi:hypothetical protein
MNRFTGVDVVLGPWARMRGLHVQIAYRDEEVRSIPLADSRGAEYQIWIDRIPSGEVRVSAAAVRIKRRRWQGVGTLEELSPLLDTALGQVDAWIQAAGHHRQQF